MGVEERRLSIADCRRLVGGGTDEELALVRDQLYAVADVTVRAFVEIRRANCGDGGLLDKALDWLSEEDAEHATERAAIIEFDGGKPRAEAERQALRTILGQRCRDDAQE